MPRRIGELTETGIVAEMRAELRRLWRAVGSNQGPVGEYDEYTLASSSDSAHTLTYIPSLSLIPVACLNGLPGRYGTDYTVDFATGIVTWSATKVAGDILSVFYQTTGDLVALSGVAATGLISDNFNRADSSTTMNPASDGGTWTIDSSGGLTPVYGVLTNRGYLPSAVGTLAMARRDTGQVDADVTVTIGRSSTAGAGFVWFAWDPSTLRGYSFQYDSSSVFASIQKWSSGLSSLGTNVSVAAWTGGTTTIRITYNHTTGFMSFYQNGTLKTTWTDTSPITAPGSTWVGLSASASNVDTWDDFSAVIPQ